jgi:hypothetical protein
VIVRSPAGTPTPTKNARGDRGVSNDTHRRVSTFAKINTCQNATTSRALPLREPRIGCPRFATGRYEAARRRESPAIGADLVLPPQVSTGTSTERPPKTPSLSLHARARLSGMSRVKPAGTPTPRTSFEGDTPGVGERWPSRMKTPWSREHVHRNVIRPQTPRASRRFRRRGRLRLGGRGCHETPGRSSKPPHHANGYRPVRKKSPSEQGF